MKKRLMALLCVCALLFTLAGCGSSADSTTSSDGKTVVRWNAGTSGNVLVTIANEKGYFADEGIELEMVPANANTDAMTMLSTDKVDIVSNAGTSNPLQQIAAGEDFTIFGGHMVNGAMPIIAKKGTEWKGVESLIGKKFAANPSYFALTGAVMDLGYDNPLEVVDWVSYSDYNDALAAVVSGEVDYALMGTGQNYQVQTMDDVEVMCYQSDIMPDYSCCRLVARTDYVNKNADTIQKILVALMRAQEYYEAHPDEAVELQAKEIGADEDYVAAYMKNDHYKVSVDPLKNSVERAWEILDKTGFLSDNAKEINIDDHINTEIYQKALAEYKDKYGSENPDFVQSLETYFQQNDQ